MIALLLAVCGGAGAPTDIQRFAAAVVAEDYPAAARYWLPEAASAPDEVATLLAQLRADMTGQHGTLYLDSDLVATIARKNGAKAEDAIKFEISLQQTARGCAARPAGALGRGHPRMEGSKGRGRTRTNADERGRTRTNAGRSASYSTYAATLASPASPPRPRAARPRACSAAR